MIKQATCKQGHPMKPPNLIYRTVKGRDVRECRTCANAAMRRRREERNKKKGKKPKKERKVAKETKQEKSAEVDPMDFLGESASPSAAEQMDEAMGGIEPGDPESPHAITAGTSLAVGAPLRMRTVHLVQADGGWTNIPFEELKIGDRFVLLDPDPNPIEDGTQIYTATGDAVTCEPDGNWMVTVESYPGKPISLALPSAADLDAAAKEQALAEATAIPSIAVEKREAPPTPVTVAAHPAPTDAHGNAFDATTKTVPVAVPKPPPRRVGCVHGFQNKMLCPTCRAGG